MNGYFTIPNTPEIPADEQRQVSSPDVVYDLADTHEQLYARHRVIAENIEQLRSRATTKNIRQSVRDVLADTFSPTPRSLLERLVEEESVIGGALFTPKNEPLRQRRFWYYNDGWFYDDAAATHGTLWYKIHDKGITKLEDAKEVPFVDGERETIVRAIELYYGQVAAQLYGTRDDFRLAA